jgi:hypothetical protein
MPMPMRNKLMTKAMKKMMTMTTTSVESAVELE